MKWPQEEMWNSCEIGDAVFRDFDLDSIPYTLKKCPVCCALLESWDTEKHQRWHEETS